MNRTYRIGKIVAGIGVFVAVFDMAIAADLPANAPGHLVIREHMPKDDRSLAYWEGFVLKAEGECAEAVEKLRPLANQGRGFEEAQHALGICLLRLAGLEQAIGGGAVREAIISSPLFTEGRLWIRRAAEAGNFAAQSTMVRLYASALGPDDDAAEAAKWLHLYQRNPIRLALASGEPLDIIAERFALDLAPHALAEGAARARRWTPTFWLPAPTAHSK